MYARQGLQSTRCLKAASSCPILYARSFSSQIQNPAGLPPIQAGPQTLKRSVPLTSHCVYSSSVDINEAVDVAWKKCLLGNLLSAGGIASLIFAVLPVASQITLGALLVGMAALPAISLTRVQQSLKDLAVQQVEKISVLSRDSTSPWGKDSAGSTANSEAEAAAAAELLAAIREVELEIITPSVVRHLVLQEPPKRRWASRTSEFIHHSPYPQFCDLFTRPSWDSGSARSSRRGSLHVDWPPSEDGRSSSSDPVLLKALLRSRKLVIGEAVALRQEASNHVRYPDSTEPSTLTLNSEAFSSGQADSPSRGIVKLGDYSLLRGLAMLIAGGALQLVDVPAYLGSDDDDTDLPPISSAGKFYGPARH
eukprot:TRINITY_DN48463_c0_g1_i1.p1 TRINITY_DN48463_c0_g1~~TRINITY_DN48463_c0_g1_i1.p1  ORF type:complete len:366 (+),score=45.67 TRINITY_DN48463_c0_g1_i1:123-1220(+)